MIWHSIQPGDTVRVQGRRAGEWYRGLTLVEVTPRYIVCEDPGGKIVNFPRGRGYIVEKVR